MKIGEAQNRYYEHLDRCEQCEQHPFAQCPVGQALLLLAGKEAKREIYERVTGIKAGF